MKRKKNFLSKLKARWTLKTYQKPLFMTVVILLIVNLIILLVATGVGLALDASDPDNYNATFGGNFFIAFATCLKWMISPNSINSFTKDTNLRIIILAAVVIAIEMILFSGAIVATLTTALRALVDKKSKAKGAISVEHHFVILNWSSKVPDMVYNLLQKDYDGNIVILSNKSKEYIEGEIQSLIKTFDIRKKGKLKLIIKEGNPVLHGDLSDIAVDQADHICVVSREDMSVGEYKKISNADLFSLKVMLALGNFNINSDCNIVVEVDSDSVRGQINRLAHTVVSLKDKCIIPISFNKQIGQIIAQSIVNPIMSDVYLNLFSFEGSEFYSCDTKYTIEEYLENRDNSIPIIKLGKMFVLADDNKQINKNREKPKNFAKKLNTIPLKIEEPYTYFIIGQNKKSDFVIENLKLATLDKGKALELKIYDKDDTKGLIRDINSTDGMKKVLILSDDTVSEESYDANVFVTLIELQNAFPSRKNISFITELLDSRNLQSVRDFNIKNTIISNRMTSLLMTNLAMNKYSDKFFNNLLTVDVEESGECFDIVAKPISELLEPDSRVFSSRAELIHSVYYSFEKKYMLLGYIKDDKMTFVCNNQDSPEIIEFKDEDQLIYIYY